MSTIQSLRQFVSQRLTVAVEEIIGVFEKTITEYEEEIRRQRRMLGAEPRPGVRTATSVHAGVFHVVGADVPPGPQESSHSPDQQPHIKEELEEVLTSPDGQDVHEPVHGLVQEPVHRQVHEPVYEQVHELFHEQVHEPVYEQVQGLDQEDSPPVSAVKTEPDESPLPEVGNIPEAETTVCSQTGPMSSEAGEGERGPAEPGFDLDIGGFLKATTNGQLFLSHCFTTEDGDWNLRPEPQTFSDCLRGHQGGTWTDKHVHKCPACGKSFQYNTALQRHIRCHTGERPFDCTVCEKKFKQKGGLQAHMRKHTGEKPFSCTVCGKNFAQNGTLASHMRIHTGEKPFSCPMCKKKYSERGTLVRHMRVHTGEKPFSCTLCGKRFSEKGNLNKHKRIHTGEKPFGCNICEKRFSLMSHLKNHRCPGKRRPESVPTTLIKGPQLTVQLNRDTL
ncbi:zinc finger protein 771-like [Sphaeramia orbicularis]|uniref:Zinc finger protein 771-like n=1 Tax=Sphaeramia orbicularis TaxID=375764 RepID=A0A673A8Y0_9TELE|nr:zinc finger protein 771-like [Sphaeramia orbicularis]